jgi:hypothetical protein
MQYPPAITTKHDGCREEDADEKKNPKEALRPRIFSSVDQK